MFFRELTGRLWDWFGSGSIVGVGCVQTVFPGFLLTFSGLGWIIYLLMGLGWVGLLWLPIWKCSPGKRKWVFVWFSVLGWSLWLVMFFFLENVLPGNKLGSFEIIWVWLLWLVVRFCFMENVFPRNKGIVCEMFWFEFDNRGWRWRAYIYIYIYIVIFVFISLSPLWKCFPGSKTYYDIVWVGFWLLWLLALWFRIICSLVDGVRTVKKLRLSKALTIPEGTTVSDACRRMAARRVDAVLLTDSNALLSGIVTDKVCRKC